MPSNPLREIRRKLGFTTQAAFAEKLGVTQQALSTAEKKSTFPIRYREKLLRVFPEKHLLIQAALQEAEEDGPLINWDEILQVMREQKESAPESSPMENEARPWVVSFRTDCLYDRLAYLANCDGYNACFISWAQDQTDDTTHALLVTEREGEEKSKGRAGSLLFPGPKRFGLKVGTAVLLGSPYRHPVNKIIVEVLKQPIGLQLEFHTSEKRRPFFFGYPTTYNDLYIQGNWYRPNRYIDGQDAVYYEDYGVILHSPLNSLTVPSRNPFGNTAKHIIVAAGCHRLATGTGARLIEDRDLRTLVLGENEDFEGVGVLAYRVLVRSGGRDFTAVEDLSLVGQWKPRP